MNHHIFREYDVRGLVAEDLTPDVVEGLGRAYGSVIVEDGGSQVAVGRDVRESSQELSSLLAAGIAAAGVDVIDLGLVPTPAVYFAVHQWDLDGGVQVTGSHNPIEYNGFKMMRGKGSLYGEQIQDLLKRMVERSFGEGSGKITRKDVVPEYMESMLNSLRVSRPLKVVIDAGNGCASVLGPELFRRLGWEVEELYCRYDGSFPNHIPDPTLPETLEVLRSKVAETGADMGVAFDGDVDRLGALDDKGGVLWGDQLLALFAREVLKQKPGAEILFEVKCSKALIEDIEAHGGKPVMTKTGHSLIKAALKQTGAPLAGEMSGHMFFADRWFGFDDALYAAGRLAELLAAADQPLSALSAALPRYHATPEMRIDCSDDRKFSVVDAVLEKYRATHTVTDIDGVRIEFDVGWGLVRASNTQPVLVVRAEGRTPEDRDAILSDISATLAKNGVQV